MDETKDEGRITNYELLNAKMEDGRQETEVSFGRVVLKNKLLLFLAPMEAASFFGILAISTSCRNRLPKKIQRTAGPKL